MDIETLKCQRKLAWDRLKVSATTLNKAKRILVSLSTRYERAKLDYEYIDRQLALVDGRFERVQAAAAAMKSGKKKVAVDLTAEQIIEIARKLGIELPDVPELETGKEFGKLPEDE